MRRQHRRPADSQFRALRLSFLTLVAFAAALALGACNDERAGDVDPDATTLDGGTDAGGDSGVDVGGDAGLDTGVDTSGPCDGPSPAGCVRDDECDEGQLCVQDGVCRSSHCECDPLTGSWMCADDCGGGACVDVPDDCAVDSDCPEPLVCEDGVCDFLDCPDLWAPVCGADGYTYDNACLARMARVEVIDDNPCPDAGCEDDDVCEFGAEWCEEGICIPCPDYDCASCPPGYNEIRRNGCFTCGCEPVRECESDRDCGDGGTCVGVGDCDDSCVAGDPECCAATMCRYSSPCEGPNPQGCRATGCPDGMECVTDVPGVCIPSSCGCDDGTGRWSCSTDCGGGMCMPMTGPCDGDRDCPVGELCIDGVCEAGGCDDVWAPVCGVDGETYSNECYAAYAHVEVAYTGECRADLCEVDRDCPLYEVCEGGECVDAGCTRVWDPVCGVDGETYGNPCNARAAHVEVAYAGECEVDCGENPAGCTPGECPRGEACVVLDDMCLSSGCACDAATGTWVCTPDCGGGICVPTPEGCRSDADCEIGRVCVEGVCSDWGCPDLWDPVCGVDNRTYGNRCEARVAHVEVAYPGECELGCEGPSPAGCSDDAACRDGEACVPSDATICLPSACFCDPSVGDWICTDDCGGGVCVPDEEARCTRDRECGFDQVCVYGECTSITSDMCLSNSDCRRGEICYPETNLCQPPCEIDCFRPEYVCGDDGVTYSCGERSAWCAGAEVEYPGECGELPD